MRFVTKYLLLSLLIVGMTIGMLSSLFSFQEILQRITGYTNLSAWSLAQMELEYQQLTNELRLYQAGQSNVEQVQLAYDIAWNRMDIFLHGRENEAIRKHLDTEALVSAIFDLIKTHENFIDQMPDPNSPELANWIHELQLYQPKIRKVMIQSFTGTGVTQGIEDIRSLISHISFILTFVSLLTLCIGFFLYREARQHWYLSLHDPLTKLLNRPNFKRLLNKQCSDLSTKTTPAVFVLIDISHFNEVNNLFGYHVGDDLLRRIGETLKSVFTKNEVLLGRISSCGFALFGEQNIQNEQLQQVFNQIEQLLKEYDPAGRMLVRAGISRLPQHATKSDDLYQYAELALMEAKKIQRSNRCEFNDLMLLRIQRRRELAIHLRQGFMTQNHSGLYMCYQPIHKLKNNTIGVEALIRWQHPLLGFISPFEIIDIAEEYGLGSELGEWIFQRVLLDIESLPNEYLSRLEVSINLSESIFNTELPEKLNQLLATSTVGQQRLILEVTETIALQDFNTSQLILRTLRDDGIRIALDDFGTGYSSLSYLKDLPVDKLKIDKSFIMNIHKDERLHQMVKHITQLAHDLDLIVVAEGVETIDEHNTVLDMGVAEIQGYYFSKPLTIDQLKLYLASHFSASDTM